MSSPRPPAICTCSALIELGLVLFLLTFVINGLARLLIVATERGSGMAHA